MKETKMSTLTWVLTGLAIAVVFNLSLRLFSQPLLRWNLFVGILGAFAAGILIAPLFGIEIVTQRVFSYPSMFVALGGALVLLAAVYLLQRQKQTAD
jgi:uncharacterized membrane protein YeaQ/YmgE (transglycosylase-associated protein family)